MPFFTVTSQKTELDEEIKYLGGQVNELVVEYKKLREGVVEALHTAKTVIGEEINDPERSVEIHAKLETLPTDDEEIENLMSMLRLRCQGIANVDESILEEYQKCQREIDLKTQELNELETEAKNVEKEIETIKPRWVNTLKELIGQIDRNFGDFMMKMHYSGEVYLFEADKKVCAWSGKAFALLSD